MKPAFFIEIQNTGVFSRPPPPSVGQVHRLINLEFPPPPPRCRVVGKPASRTLAKKFSKAVKVVTSKKKAVAKPAKKK